MSSTESPPVSAHHRGLHPASALPDSPVAPLTHECCRYFNLKYPLRSKKNRGGCLGDPTLEGNDADNLCYTSLLQHHIIIYRYYDMILSSVLTTVDAPTP